jgi:dolichol-phosphate mannosyltransferase
MFRQIQALGLDADVLFMDDGSPDGTGGVLDELAAGDPRLHVIHRAGKLGIGSAHLDGIAWAYDHGYKRLITMDCDFTHSPTDIPRLLERAGECDVVVGSRWIRPGSLPGWNPLRRFLTNFGHFLTRSLLGLPYDATGAFRVYNLARIPRPVFAAATSCGYSFFFESLFLLVRNGLPIGETAIALPARTYGHSKMSMRQAMRSAARVLGLYVAMLLDPARFCVIDPVIDIDPNLVDPQNWDQYWETKTRAGGLVYDAIATIYRNMFIRSGLNRCVRKHFPRGSRLLHAGCGSGQVDRDIQNEMEIAAVDISVAALQLYRKNNPRAESVKHGSLFSLPFPDAAFDGAYNMGVMEHFTGPDIRRALAELHRVVKAGGKVILFWPHARASSVTVLRAVHWVLNDVLKKNVRLHPPEISLLRSRRSIEPVLREARFELVDYYFGPRDLFVQAVLVLRKAGSVV